MAEVPVVHELVHQDLLLLACAHVHVKAEAVEADQVPVVEGGNGSDLAMSEMG